MSAPIVGSLHDPRLERRPLTPPDTSVRTNRRDGAGKVDGPYQYPTPLQPLMGLPHQMGASYQSDQYAMSSYYPADQYGMMMSGYSPAPLTPTAGWGAPPPPPPPEAANNRSDGGFGHRGFNSDSRNARNGGLGNAGPGSASLDLGDPSSGGLGSGSHGSRGYDAGGLGSAGRGHGGGLGSGGASSRAGGLGSGGLGLGGSASDACNGSSRAGGLGSRDGQGRGGGLGSEEDGGSRHRSGGGRSRSRRRGRGRDNNEGEGSRGLGEGLAANYGGVSGGLGAAARGVSARLLPDTNSEFIGPGANFTAYGSYGPRDDREMKDHYGMNGGYHNGYHTDGYALQNMGPAAPSMTDQNGPYGSGAPLPTTAGYKDRRRAHHRR